MANKKTTSKKTTAKKPASGKTKAEARGADTAAAAKANIAAKAELDAHRARAAATSESLPPLGSMPHGHPQAVPHAGGHPMFGWSAPWGPPPGMPWQAYPPAAMHPPGEAPSGSRASLLTNIGTMLRLGTDLINAGLMGGSHMAYGMSAMGTHGPYRHPEYGHWYGHGCGCASHGECCCSPCTTSLDCCCAYGCLECRPGVHNCP